MNYCAVIALFGLLVAMVHGECGSLQRLQVKKNWKDSFGTTHQRAEMARVLWRDIFSAYKELPGLYFERVHGDNIYSPEFKAHSARIFGGFDIAIATLDEEDVFNAEMAHLAEQHKKYNIDAKYYPVFIEAMGEVVGNSIGGCFDKDAWDACGKLISDGIIGA